MSLTGGQAREGNGRKCSLAHTRLKVWTNGVKNITNWHQARHQNLQPWLHFALKIVSVTQSTKRSTEGALAREPEEIRSDIMSQRDREGTYSKFKETERNMRGRERKIHIYITARRHWFWWIIMRAVHQLPQRSDATRNHRGSSNQCNYLVGVCVCESVGSNVQMCSGSVCVGVKHSELGLRYFWVLLILHNQLI